MIYFKYSELYLCEVCSVEQHSINVFCVVFFIVDFNFDS
jgi:hypothetical protein